MNRNRNRRWRSFVRNSPALITFVVIIAIVLISIALQVRVYMACDDGVVVKNSFDWPVCIEKGKH